MDVIIYHNPACGTSRNTLGLIHNAGIEPHVIEYLKTPPSRRLLHQLLWRAGLSVRDALRERAHFPRTGPWQPRAERRRIARRPRGPSDPDQPAPGGHAQGRQALPALRGRARLATAATGRI